MQIRNSANGRYESKYTAEELVLYRVWGAMKHRCANPNDKRFKNYGGRGITVCEEWQNDYLAFYKWAVSNGYKKGLTIDRIDTDGNYCPENCRWATPAQQNRNYSRNHLVTYNGKTMCIADWATHFGINRATVLFRLKQGKPLDEVFSTVDGRTTRWKK